MNPKRFLLAAGAGAFVLTLVAQAPAALLGGILRSADISTGAFRGTIWRGEARGIRAGELQVDQLRWGLKPAQLLLGRLAGDLSAEVPGGFARGELSLGLTGRMVLTDLSAAAPLAALVPGAAGLAPGSELALQLARFAWWRGRPEGATGTIRLANLDLGVPGAPASGRGSFIVDFDSPAVPPGEALSGRLADLGGPLEVAGLVLLTEGWSYEITGTARARPGAPAELSQALQLAGPQRADGSYEFSLAGSL